MLTCPQLLFQEDLEITHMYSAEGEEVKLSFSIYPSSNVEDWLREVERSMKTSVRDIIEKAIKAYPTVRHSSYPSTASQPGRSFVCSLLHHGSWAQITALTAAALSQPGDLWVQGVPEVCSWRNLKICSRK